jgi:hypothetical protein
MNAAGFGSAQQTVLPSEIVTAVEDCGFFESIPLWGGDAYWRAFYHGAVIHSDYVGVRQVFQALPIHRHCVRSAFHLCRLTEPECGNAV